jgi:hypothetical protein
MHTQTKKKGACIKENLNKRKSLVLRENLLSFIQDLNEGLP